MFFSLQSFYGLTNNNPIGNGGNLMLYACNEGAFSEEFVEELNEIGLSNTEIEKLEESIQDNEKPTNMYQAVVFADKIEQDLKKNPNIDHKNLKKLKSKLIKLFSSRFLSEES